jgi:hypothetical protein
MYQVAAIIELPCPNFLKGMKGFLGVHRVWSSTASTVLDGISGDAAICAPLQLLTLPGSSCVFQHEDGQKKHVSAGASVICSAARPSSVVKQSAMHAVGCEVCQEPGRFENMAICCGCDCCFHLQCVMPTDVYCS